MSRGGPRKFDHDEARRRHATGETFASIARDMGVSESAVQRIKDPETTARWNRTTQASIERHRAPCRGGCGKLVWMHGTKRSGFCQVCLGERVNVVRHGTETEYQQGCRCGLCMAAMRENRARRRKHATPAVHNSVGYRNGCRCAECRKDMTLYRREQRAKVMLQ